MTDTDRKWTVLAHIVRPQGRRGEVLAEILTDFPERFAERERLFLRPASGSKPGQEREVHLEQHWLHKGRVVLRFAGIDSITAAEALRGLDVAIPREERATLQAEEAYVGDLIGARLIDVSREPGTDTGEIIGVTPEGAGAAMLVVKTAAGEEVLIPFVKAYLRRMDLEAGRVEMALPEGLLTINAPMTAAEKEEARLRAEGGGDAD